MAQNKRCHNHLANKEIITFIINIFHSQFYGKYSSAAENDALHRTIKKILHIFARLIHDEIVGKEILERNVVPIFSQIEERLYQANVESGRINDLSKMVKTFNDSLLSGNWSQRTGTPPTARKNEIKKTRIISGKKLLESYV